MIGYIYIHSCIFWLQKHNIHYSATKTITYRSYNNIRQHSNGTVDIFKTKSLLGIRALCLYVKFNQFFKRHSMNEYE